MAFDPLYADHEFAALMVSPPNMFIPVEAAGDATTIVLFSFCLFLNILSASSLLIVFSIHTSIYVQYLIWQNC